MTYLFCYVTRYVSPLYDSRLAIDIIEVKQKARKKEKKMKNEEGRRGRDLMYLYS